MQIKKYHVMLNISLVYTIKKGFLRIDPDLIFRLEVYLSYRPFDYLHTLLCSQHCVQICANILFKITRVICVRFENYKTKQMPCYTSSMYFTLHYLAEDSDFQPYPFQKKTIKEVGGKTLLRIHENIFLSIFNTFNILKTVLKVM